MEQSVLETVGYSARCQDCGAEVECRGVQVLAEGRLRWDVESTCSACGFALAVCGGEVPSELRERMLAEHGPATLRVLDAAADTVVIMRVLRAELGIDLAGARAAARRVLSGDYAGTLPEMESLARKLRAAAIPAAADRP
ncbi:hypothetical protein ACIRSU_00920 [Streptomyces sp. NPDC101160]|uniref:hypothetical protein n=1 Tax=Streptomyces sp. NPDC101160 TaxID=3366118 RepID=UPI00380D3F66